MVVDKGIIKVGTHQIHIPVCMEMKTLMPTMSFSAIINSFSSTEIIPDDEFEQVLETLENTWLALNPSDIEWTPIEDESPIE